MTGIYSYGGEMLRNVESFWCPIKFYNDKKCDNCKIDFPDINEWVSADKDIEEVKSLLLDKYNSGSLHSNSWFGHPSRKEKSENI